MALLAACAAPAKAPQAPQADAAGAGDIRGRMAALSIVDCLLPGQVRMLGGRTYMTPRRPTRTTAADCRVRGGEFVAYDRADYKTALGVWMPAAEQGDAEAQVNVGEIFERGLGAAPNYEAARLWYEKSAAQGNRRAQFNLGTFFEQGLGVAPDPMQALNWYRQAWGIPQDNITFRSTVDRELASLEERYRKEIRQRQLQIDALDQQVRALRATLSSGSEQAARDIRELEDLVADLRQQQRVADRQVEAIRLREPAGAPRVAVAPKPGAAAEIRASDINFGRYYALVVGNQDYDKIDDLQTPANDATAIGQVLAAKYGFEVTTLLNADTVTVMEEVNRLSELLTESDNLLIFYAGHGVRRRAVERESGYWLPVNADAAPNDTYWVSNEFVSGHLARIQARRVLVISDSCYAGLLSTAPAFVMLESRDEPDPQYLAYKAKRRSRLLISSGGDRPVLDNGGDHSVFAGAVLQVLNENRGMLMGPELFRRVSERTVAAARQFNVEQTPEFKVIKGAGHEVGDFFLIPRSS